MENQYHILLDPVILGGLALWGISIVVGTLLATQAIKRGFIR
jgi:hypothetical protein